MLITNVSESNALGNYTKCAMCLCLDMVQKEKDTIRKSCLSGNDNFWMIFSSMVRVSS